VAAGFIAAARAGADGGGSDTYTLPVVTASMEEVVAAIREAAGAAADLTFDPAPLPFPAAFETSAVERRLSGPPLMSLLEGVRRTVAVFRTAAAEGRLDVDRLLGPRS
jgi:hypothetical protein